MPSLALVVSDSFESGHLRHCENHHWLARRVYHLIRSCLRMTISRAGEPAREPTSSESGMRRARITREGFETSKMDEAMGSRDGPEGKGFITVS